MGPTWIVWVDIPVEEEVVEVAVDDPAATVMVAKATHASGQASRLTNIAQGRVDDLSTQYAHPQSSYLDFSTEENGDEGEKRELGWKTKKFKFKARSRTGTSTIGKAFGLNTLQSRSLMASFDRTSFARSG